MENEFEINSELLDRICVALDGITTPDNSLQMKIFNQFQDLHSRLPTFCFYLLHIISSDQFPFNRRFCSLLVLNRNFSRIIDELIPQFISMAKPLFEQIIKLPFSPFTSISASILCSIAKLYGLNNFPDFFEQISYLFSDKDTIQIGLECLKDMVQNGQSIPDFLIQILPSLINSPFYKKVLDISYLMCSSNIDFVNESIVPSIFSFFQIFDEDSLAQAASISTLSYLNFPNEITANFIIECLNMKCRKISENILIEFNNDLPFTLYPPLVEALLMLLEIPDDDLTEFGPCSMSQEILKTAADRNGIQFIQIVKIFISGHFTFLNELFQSIIKGHVINQDLNVGFFLRCLYTILFVYRDSCDSEEIESDFRFYYTIIVASFNSPFRGDASLCLMSFCSSNQQLVTESFARISPLLVDCDQGVRVQAMIALEQLVEYDNLAPNVEQLSFLVELMKTTNEPVIGRLANRYAQHLPVLNDSDQYVLGVYREVMDFFVGLTSRVAENLNQNCEVKKICFESLSVPIYQSLVDLLALLVVVVVEPFELLDKRIFNAVLVVLSYDAFDTNIFSSYFELIISLLKTYLSKIVNEINSGNIDALNFLSTIQTIFQKVATIIINESDASLLLIKDGYEIISMIVSDVQQIQDQLLQDASDENLMFCHNLFTFSMDHFTLDNDSGLDDEFDEVDESEIAALNVELCCLIADVMTSLVPKMNLEIANSFFGKCCKIVNYFSSQVEEVTAHIKHFGLTLICLLKANNIAVCEGVLNIFMS